MGDIDIISTIRMVFICNSYSQFFFPLLPIQLETDPKINIK